MENKTDREKIEDVSTRGVANIIPGKEELRKVLESGRKLNIFLGIDPTSTKIHLGHAVPLRRLQLLVDLGHNVTFLIGDFTALIGDTSDKESERPVLTYEQIEENFSSYKRQASKFLDFSKVRVVHNSEWLDKLTFGEIIKLCRHFSLNDFISRELIKKRLTEGKSVSLPEVLYPVMQGYDSWFMDTDIQLGGTDQVFNMQAGRTLQKNLRGKESFIIENAFLPGTDGRKMSKTWGNGIWLEDSPEDVYGKVMSVNDAVINDYFVLGTSLPMTEVETFAKRLSDGENPMIIKKELASIIVTEMYGEKEADGAAEHFQTTVVDKKPMESVSTHAISFSSLPTINLPSQLVSWGTADSNSEAKRLVDQGAVYINDMRVDPSSVEIKFPGKENIVRVGKRKYVKLVKD